MRITVLTHLDPDDPAPDPVVPQVMEALRRRGHEAGMLDVGGDAARLARELQALRPGLVFNLAEEFEGDDHGDAPLVALLDLLRLPYTGCGPRALYLTQQKVLAKKILAFEGITTPRFAVFTRNDRMETGGNLRLPLFVKPLALDSSFGIDASSSLVSDLTSLLERVRAIQEDLHDAALAEEYVEGREFYVGLLGNDDPEALPVVEMDFSGLPPGALKVADWNAKWEEGTAEYRGTRTILPELPDDLRARLHDTARRAWHALGLRGYARVDMRVATTGEVHVLEVNGNPYLDRDGELARAAAQHGLTHDDLVERIATLAMQRHRARIGGDDGS